MPKNSDSILTPSKPTIRDIAQICGVSEATVSYVINGKRVLKPETRARVQQVIRDLNYHPSAMARGLNRKSVQTIGVFFGVVVTRELMVNPYSSGILSGIFAEAAHENLNVTLYTASWENAAVSAPPFSDGRSDGVIMVAPTLESGIVEGLFATGTPIVGISTGKSEIAPDVDVDNYAGLQMATQHLLNLGHRRIAFIMGDSDLAAFAPRKAGFCDVMQQAGIAVVPEFLIISTFGGQLAREQTRKLLQHAQPPTAIVTANDAIAMAVLEAAREMGVNVPGDLSVVGFDDNAVASQSTPGLTTVHQPLFEIGATAAKLLVNLIRDSRLEENCHLLPPELVVRGSTARNKF